MKLVYRPFSIRPFPYDRFIVSFFPNMPVGTLIFKLYFIFSYIILHYTDYMHICTLRVNIHKYGLFPPLPIKIKSNSKHIKTKKNQCYLSLCFNYTFLLLLYLNFNRVIYIFARQFLPLIKLVCKTGFCKIRFFSPYFKYNS